MALLQERLRFPLTRRILLAIALILNQQDEEPVPETEDRIGQYL